MKKIFLALISLILLGFYVSAEEAVQKIESSEQAAPKAEPEKGTVYEGMPITPEFSKEVIDKITAKYSKMYESYAGVKNKRYVTVEYRDPKTNELLETEKYVYTRKDYWYKDLDYELHSCESDGKPRKQGVLACNPHEDEPGIPHFDKNGEKEYIRELVAVEKLNGRLAYKIKMTARKPKKEHFVGHVWCPLTTSNICRMRVMPEQKDLEKRNFTSNIRRKTSTTVSFSTSQAVIPEF